jgi:hypothetical protein
MVEEFARLFIRSNVCFKQPSFLTVLHIYIRFLNTDLPRADGFDLRSMQGDASLEFLNERIFETGFAVGCDNFDVFSHKMILTWNDGGRLQGRPFKV